MSKNPICPVCERESATGSGCGCGTCGFAYAFVPWFAGEESRRLWLGRVEAARRERETGRIRQFAPSGRFSVWSSMIALRQGDALTILHGNGRVQTEAKAVELSAAENNYAILYADGTVKVFGVDNSCGQKNTSQWKNIRHVAVGPYCTYGVMEDGRVLIAGSPAGVAVQSWTNVERLVVGMGSVIALHRDGSLSVAGDFPAGLISQTKGWKDIRDVAISRDIIAGLRGDGTVVCSASPGNERAQAAQWQNVVALCADNTFLYGLMGDGTVKVAGSCKRFLDRGRSKAAEWKDIAGISSNQAGVGAVTREGALLFAGTMNGDVSRVLEEWKQAVQPSLQF